MRMILAWLVPAYQSHQELLAGGRRVMIPPTCQRERGRGHESTIPNRNARVITLYAPVP